MKRALGAVGIGLLALMVLVGVRALGGAQPGRGADASAPLPGAANVPADAALARFSRALRFETISHSPDSARELDAEAFVGFRRFLEASYPRVHATLEREIVSDYSLLYRWPGSDESLTPALFLGHFDVVPVDPVSLDAWTHPPFAGVVDGGYVWGRGSFDNKINVIGLLEAAELLLAAGFAPERTLYLSFGHDEELGGKRGAAIVAERFRQRGQRLALVVDEGGAIVSGLFPGLEVPLAAIGVAEKGAVGVELVVETEGGHSSMPTGHSAIGILAAAIGRLEDQPMPSHFGDQLGATLEAVAPHLGFGYRIVLRNLWLFGPLLEATLVRQPQVAPMLRTTTAPTIFQAGVKENVLPSRARAVVNFRIFPGDTIESVVAHVRRVIDDDRIQLATTSMQSEPSTVSRLDGPAGTLLADTLRQVYGDIAIAPILIPGGTDARHFRDLSDGVFGFAAAQVDAEDIRRAHGIDERIPSDGFVQGIGFYAELLTHTGRAGEAELPEPDPGS